MKRTIKLGKKAGFAILVLAVSAMLVTGALITYFWKQERNYTGKYSIELDGTGAEEWDLETVIEDAYGGDVFVEEHTVENVGHMAYDIECTEEISDLVGVSVVFTKDNLEGYTETEHDIVLTQTNDHTSVQFDIYNNGGIEDIVLMIATDDTPLYLFYYTGTSWDSWEWTGTTWTGITKPTEVTLYESTPTHHYGATIERDFLDDTFYWAIYAKDLSDTLNYPDDWNQPSGYPPDTTYNSPDVTDTQQDGYLVFDWATTSQVLEPTDIIYFKTTITFDQMIKSGTYIIDHLFDLA